MPVKLFIDLQSPRKRDVITPCKVADAVSVHNAVYALLIFGKEAYIMWYSVILRLGFIFQVQRGNGSG